MLRNGSVPSPSLVICSGETLLYELWAIVSSFRLRQRRLTAVPDGVSRYYKAAWKRKKESARARSRTCCNLFATFVEKPQPRKDERKEKQNNMYRVHFLESISIIPHVVVDNSSFRKDNSIPELILWSWSRKGGLKWTLTVDKKDFSVFYGFAQTSCFDFDRFKFWLQYFFFFFFLIYLFTQ